jgi:hypothetical protein
MSIYWSHEKKRLKILQPIVFFELQRPFDLENRVKVTVYDLKIAKAGVL